MGVATSLVAIAVGAILRWAVTVQNSHGWNINRIGLILLIVGIIGLIVSFIFWGSWGGFGTSYRRRTYRQGPPTQYDQYGNPVHPGNPPGENYISEEHRRF